MRRVVLDAQRQYIRFPGGRWQFVAVEQFQHRFQAVRPLSAVLRSNALPREEEALKFRDGYWLDFRAQAVDSQAVNASQQPAVAPFDLGCARMKFSTQNEAFGFQGEQGSIDFLLR